MLLRMEVANRLNYISVGEGNEFSLVLDHVPEIRKFKVSVFMLGLLQIFRKYGWQPISGKTTLNLFLLNVNLSEFKDRGGLRGNY